MSAVKHESSAVSRQPSVVSRQPSAVSRQPSAVSRHLSVVSRQRRQGGFVAGWACGQTGRRARHRRAGPPHSRFAGRQRPVSSDGLQTALSGILARYAGSGSRMLGSVRMGHIFVIRLVVLCWLSCCVRFLIISSALRQTMLYIRQSERCFTHSADSCEYLL